MKFIFQRYIFEHNEYCLLMKFLIEMALLKAFQKQLEKKPCPICGHLVTRGLYRSHLNHCKLQSDDDDCQVCYQSFS